MINLKPTPEQYERGEQTEPLWELHNCINKLISAAALDIIDGVNAETRKRQLYADIQVVSARYLQ